MGMGMGMGRRTNTSLAGINEAMPAFLISYPLEILSRMIGRLARINFYIPMYGVSRYGLLPMPTYLYLFLTSACAYILVHQPA